MQRRPPPTNQQMQKLINQAVKEAMTPLNQPALEKMLQNKLPAQHPYIVIYFTAKWSGPCNNLPLDKIVASNADVQWFICDVDDNNYSAGYCGVKSVPSFMAVVHGKSQPVLSTSDSAKIFLWLSSLTSIPKQPLQSPLQPAPPVTAQKK